MPNRIIKESVTTSPSLDSTSNGAECFFYRLLTVVDDRGRFDADPRVLLARTFPLRVDRLKLSTVAGWLNELVKAGIVRLYTVDGRTYGYFVSWEKHQRVYNVRPKFPEPPADCGNLPQPAADSGSYLKSESISISKSIPAHAGPEGFDRFWKAYPKKKSRGQAEKAWAKLKPDEQLQDRIVDAIERAKTSAQWQKDGGTYIPYPATWLNSKGWLDEESSSVSDWKQQFLEGSA